MTNRSYLFTMTGSPHKSALQKRKCFLALVLIVLSLFLPGCSSHPVFDADANPNQIGSSVENPAQLGEFAPISLQDKRNNVQLCVKEVIGGEEAKELTGIDSECTVIVFTIRVNKLATTRLSLPQTIEIIKKNGVIESDSVHPRTELQNWDYIGDLEFGAVGSADAYIVFACDINTIKAISYTGENYTTYFSAGDAADPPLPSAF